jgi:Rieske Fe-S protein
MILVLEPDAPDGLVAEICREVEALGCGCEVSRGEEQLVIALSGPIDNTRLEAILDRHPEVEAIPILDGRDYWMQASRRKFVRALAGGFGLLTGVSLAVPVIGFLLPPRKELSQPSLMRAASVEQVPENSAKLVRFQGRPVLLIHGEASRYHAVSAICTHMNVCQVEWDASRKLLMCPCHGGAFDVYGNVVQGPPPRPLRTFEVEVQGEHIFIRREG